MVTSLIVTAVALLAVLPFALGNPLIVGASVAGVAVAVWLVRQGGYRLALGALLIFTLGATSTIPELQTAATVGRPAALLLLIMIVIGQTRNIKPTMSHASGFVFGTLYTLAILALLSAIWSVDPAGSLTQGAVFFGMVLVIHRSATRRWTDLTVLVADAKMVVTLTSLALAAGLLAHYAGILPVTYSGRYQGLLNNPNMAGQISIVVTFLAWGLYRETRSKRYLMPIAISLLTIILSESRTAILAVAAGCVFLVLRSGVRGAILAASVGFAGLVAFLSFGSQWLDPILGRFGEVAAGDTLSGRSFIWDIALDLIQARPIGYGWGTTSVLFEGLDSTSVHSIHNSYLQTAVEGGVLALVLTGLIYVVLFWRLAALMFRRIQVSNPGGVVAGFAAAVFAGFVGQFSESGIFGVGQAYPYLYWLAVGGFLACVAVRGQGGGRESSGHLSERLATQPLGR